MSERHWRWKLTGAGVVLLLAIASVVAFAQSTGISILSVTPGTIDPSKGQLATVSYRVPTLMKSVRIYVKNSAGSEIRGIVTYASMPAGAYSRTWDGKSNTGVAEPNGTYTICIDATTSAGAVLPTAHGTVIVSTGTTTTPPPSGGGTTTPPPSGGGTATPPTSSGAISISGVSPNPFNPATGQTTTVSYKLTTTADQLLIYVNNSAGAKVRGIVTYRSMAAGSYTRTWDGKDNNGAVVPNGAYTIMIDRYSAASVKLDSASTPVTVNTGTTSGGGGTTPPPSGGGTTPPPATGAEQGQTIMGNGSANFDWMKYSGQKFGVAFKAPKSGSINQITMQWKKLGGYGSGTYGVYTFQLQTNGSGNYPSGTVIATAANINPTTAMDGYGDGALHFNISASLVAGQIYHLVVSNVDSNPTSNWSSPNTLMSQVKTWGDFSDPRAENYASGAWHPWTSNSNIWNTGGGNAVNGGHVPLMLTWSDGTISGDPYYSAAVSAGAYIYGSNKYGEYIAWTGPSTTITRVGIGVGKQGSPGSLTYHRSRFLIALIGYSTGVYNYHIGRGIRVYQFVAGLAKIGNQRISFVLVKSAA